MKYSLIKPKVDKIFQVPQKKKGALNPRTKEALVRFQWRESFFKKNGWVFDFKK